MSSAQIHIHRAGYCIKQGTVIKSWRKRWFVLTDDALRYYKDESHDVLKGQIALARIQSVKAVPARHNRTARAATFVIATGDRDWLIQADSDASRDGWVDAINRMLAVAAANHRPPTAGAASVKSSTTTATTATTAPLSASKLPPVLENDDDDDDDDDELDVDADSDEPDDDAAAADEPAEVDLSSERPAPAETSQYVELPCVRQVDEILARAQASELENGRIASQYGLSHRVPLVDSDDDDDDDGGDGGGEKQSGSAASLPAPSDPMLDVPAERGPSMVLTKGRANEFECAACHERQRLPFFTLGARTVCEACAIDQL